MKAPARPVSEIGPQPARVGQFGEGRLTSLSWLAASWMMPRERDDDVRHARRQGAGGGYACGA